MIINTRIYASGNRSHTHMAWPRYDLEECTAGGKFDRDLARKAFVNDESADFKPYTHESTDDDLVYNAALSFLDRLRVTYDRVVANPDIDCSNAPKKRADERNDERMSEGKFVTVKVTIRRGAHGLRVAIGINNKRGIIGQSEVEARYYAAVCCQIWLRTQNKHEWVESLKCDVPDILERARKHNQDADDRAAYGNCDRRAHGYCSPAKFDCKFYRDGRCCYGE